MNAIQFNTVVSGGVIHIPEKYMKLIPSSVNVTLVPAEQERPKFKPKIKDKPHDISEFPACI